MRIAMLALMATAGAAASGSIAFASAHSGSLSFEPGRTLPTNAAAQAQLHAGPALAGHPSSEPAETDGTDPSESGSTEVTEPAPHGTPSPDLTGLCHAWLAGAGSEHGKARTNPAFTVLVTTAGGVDAVDNFCVEMLGTSSNPSSDDSEAPEPSEAESDAPHPTPSHPDRTAHPGNTAHPGRTSHPGNASHPGHGSHPGGH